MDEADTERKQPKAGHDPLSFLDDIPPFRIDEETGALPASDAAGASEHPAQAGAAAARHVPGSGQPPEQPPTQPGAQPGPTSATRADRQQSEGIARAPSDVTREADPAPPQAHYNTERDRQVRRDRSEILPHQAEDMDMYSVDARVTRAGAAHCAPRCSTYCAAALFPPTSAGAWKQYLMLDYQHQTAPLPDWIQIEKYDAPSCHV